MDTKRHHEIASTTNGGIDELKKALTRIGQPDVRCNAMLLGNWLADISQTIDPVALEPTKIKQAISLKVNRIFNGIPGRFPLPNLLAADILNNIKNQFINTLNHSVDFLLTPKNGNRRNTELFNFTRDLFRFIGYSKFVHEEHAGGPKQMDEQAFLKIFNCDVSPSTARWVGYTQYYPHEHLDRPEIFPQTDPANYETNPGTGGMYAYLNKDIQLLVGTLAEIEKEWAIPYFKEGRRIDDSSLHWNLWLAMLGKSMHMVEDFYAHTNFVDLAIDNPIFPRRQKKIYKLRRRRWSQDLPKNPSFEGNIVTGIFALDDTMVSLLHMLEEIMGNRETSTQENVQLAREVVHDPSRFITQNYQRVHIEVCQISINPNAAFNDSTNITAQFIKGKYNRFKDRLVAMHTEGAGTTINDLIRRRNNISNQTIDILLNDSAIWRGIPPGYRNSFANSIRWLSTAREFGGVLYNMYEIFKLLKDLYGSITDFVTCIKNHIQAIKMLPVNMFTGFVLQLADNTISWLYRFTRRYLRETTGEWFWGLIGAYDIGSHSLLNKDNESSDPFAEEALQLCMGVHWYIIHCMVRNNNTTRTTEIINWPNLIGYFLRNPRYAAPTSTVSGPPWWTRIIENRNWMINRSVTFVNPNYGHTVIGWAAHERDACIERNRRERTRLENYYSP